MNAYAYEYVSIATCTQCSAFSTGYVGQKVTEIETGNTGSLVRFQLLSQTVFHIFVMVMVIAIKRCNDFRPYRPMNSARHSVN